MHVGPRGQAARLVDKILLSPWQEKRLTWRAAGTLSPCPCSDVPTNVFLRFEPVFEYTASHVRAECSIDVFSKLLRGNQCPDLPNGRIKIEIKFLKQVFPHPMFKSSGVFGNLFELEPSNDNQLLN